MIIFLYNHLHISFIPRAPFCIILIMGFHAYELLYYFKLPLFFSSLFSPWKSFKINRELIFFQQRHGHWTLINFIFWNFHFDITGNLEITVFKQFFNIKKQIKLAEKKLILHTSFTQCSQIRYNEERKFSYGFGYLLLNLRQYNIIYHFYHFIHSLNLTKKYPCINQKQKILNNLQRL